jgi:hypothetical protein
LTLHWPDLALIAAIVIAGGGATYFLLQSTMRRMVAENRREMERRLAALTDAITMQEPGSSATDALSATEMEAEPPGGEELAQVDADVATTSQSWGPGERESRQQEEEIPAEIQVAIAAAAIAAFGNHARVRSARRIPSSNVVSPWTQQGRVIVQSSHNLRTQGSR